MQEVNIVSHTPDLTVALSGELDSKNADEFFDEVMEAYRQSPADVVFDCSALEFIDSTTLGTFVKILKRLKTEGHNLKLVHLQSRLKKLFTICALDTIMEISE